MPGEADDDPEWQRHYPTYSFTERDVVLAEYTHSAASVEADERMFATSSNVALIVGTVVGSLAFGKLTELYASTAAFLTEEAVYSLLASSVISLSYFALHYFAERQKALVFAKRKLIVLRRMLGLSYGKLQLVLPNWRLEGASQPFAIKMFPGWRTYVGYPFWVVGLICTAAFFFLTAHFLSLPAFKPLLVRITPEAASTLLALGLLLALAIVYRIALLDVHERGRLLVARAVARIFGVALVPDFEYVIYRAKLAVAEARRMKVPLEPIIPYLIFIEDAGFPTHGGTSLRGIARAFRDLLTRRRTSGGSTITQQLVRSLFITDYHKRWRRKILELVMAPWLHRVLPKRDQLMCYLCSVRVTERTFGILEAKRAWLNEPLSVSSPATAFILSERIGNLRDRVLPGRIHELLNRALSAKVVDHKVAAAIVRAYERLVATGALVVADPESMARLSRAFPSS